MSVLIKGMEMPKSCDDCYIANCPNDIGYTDMGKCSRHINCPIIDVPEPHGRLIDEKNICDKLRPLIETPYCYNRLQIISETLAHCLQIISDAPTVIPASEE